MLGRMYFKGDDGYQIFFSLLFNSSTLDNNNDKNNNNNNNNKTNNCISTGRSPPFHFSLAPILSILGNVRITSKINNSVLVQKTLLTCIVTIF